MGTYKTRKTGRMVALAVVGLVLGFLLAQGLDWLGWMR